MSGIVVSLSQEAGKNKQKRREEHSRCYNLFGTSMLVTDYCSNLFGTSMLVTDYCSNLFGTSMLVTDYCSHSLYSLQ